MFLYDFLSALISVVPYAFICIYPFRGNYKVSVRKFYIMLAVFVLFILAAAFVTAYLSTYHSMSFLWLWPGPGFTVIILPICFLFYYTVINVKMLKLLYVFFIVVSYANCLTAIFNFLAANAEHIIYDHARDFRRYFLFLLDILLLGITVPPILKLLRRQVRPTLLASDSPAWKILWIIPAALVTMSLVYPGANSRIDSGSLQYLLVHLLIAASSFVIYHVSIKMLEQQAKNAKLTQQLALQGEHYKSLQEHIADTKRTKHDLRHHLSMLKAYVDTNGNEKLKAYLDEYSESIGDGAETVFCQNFAVNSIVSHYLGIAKSEGVAVDVCLNLPEDACVSDTDLCIIFGNCIENAIEACRKVKGDKFIKVSSRKKGDMLAIAIDNSFDGETRIEGGNFQSLKEGGGGIGISSVKAVAEKYGASAWFEAEGNVFKAMVMLRVKQ